jgi:2-keto-4-pentenoate hydratase
MIDATHQIDGRSQVVREAAHRLRVAEQTGVPCPPVRDLIGSDQDLAYAVQQANTAHRVSRGAHVVGRKVGLTSPAVQAQLGVDQPDYGVLFNDMQVAEDYRVPAARLLQPRVEVEVAFVLDADLAGDNITNREVRNAVAYAVPALEIVDSRIDGWDITFGDTVADNGSAGLFVLGATRVTMVEFEPVDVHMTLTLNGAIASTGTGAACLGDPLNALAWLARTARDHGDPLLAGQIVLSGALGPMVGVVAGDTVTAELSSLGSVTATF